MDIMETFGKASGTYFSELLAEGIYLIGCDHETLYGRTGRAIQPQGPTGNSYLIVGTEKALLIDSMAPIPGLRDFVEQLCSVPVMLALTHGHPDHVFRLMEFDEFWIHPDDLPLLRGAYNWPAYPEIPKIIHFLRDGDVLDLGDRFVDVKLIRGHSDGSLLYLDRTSRILFSGDSITRRLLYGSCGWVPIRDFAEELERIKNLPFDRILSAHDRIFLYRYRIDQIISGFQKIPEADGRVFLPFQGGTSYIQILEGTEAMPDFLDLTFLETHREELIADALYLRQKYST